jgi:hypothetical protein
MSDNAFPSPSKKVFTYFQKILQPALTDLRVFRRQPLRGGLRTEGVVHLQKKWEIFRTTDPHSKGASRFVSSGDAP